MLRSLAFLGALALAGCGSSGPAPIVRVLDRAVIAEGAPTGELLADAAPDDDGWFAVALDDLVPVPGHPEGAARTEDGRLLLGPRSGAWMRFVDVEPGSEVVLEARLEGEELGRDYAPPYANLGLVQFESRPGRGDLDVLLASSLEHSAFTPNFPHHATAAAPRLLVRLEPTTRAVAIACVFSGDRDEARGRVVYSDLSLRAVTGADRLAEALESDPAARVADGWALGEVEVGMTTRNALALVPGTEARVPVVVPDAGGRLEAHLGLFEPNDDPLAPPPGVAVTLRCALVLAGEELPAASLGRAVISAPFGEGRWSFVSERLPARALGRRAELVFTAVAPAEWEGAAPLAAFGEPRLVPDEPARVGPNVVLVSVDTLRSDHMGAYGYERDTTPHLDALAEDALVFTDVWASSAYTLPSHMSLFTGQMPSLHTVTRPGFVRDPARSALLAEVLREAGYTTAAFTGGVFVDREFGFAAGFESYGAVDLVQLLDSDVTQNRIDEVPGLTRELIEENGTEVMVRWLEEHANESFFLFFHTYAAHEFDPPEAHRRALGFEGSLSDDDESQGLIGGGGYDPTDEQIARLLDLYDGGVRFADEGVGELLDALRRLRLLDDTLLLVTSDHGKEIGDHGLVGHGHALYEEMLQIPLIVRPPASFEGPRVGRDDRPAMLVDLLPTVLQVTNQPLLPNLQGESLLEPVSPDRVRLAELENLAVKYALREGNLKTIYSPLEVRALIPNTVEEETFDLDADPDETSPLPPDPARTDRVWSRIFTLKHLAETTGETRETGTMSASTRAQLQALGYLEDAKRQ